MSLYLVSYGVFLRILHGISKVSAKLKCLCIICSLGQVHFSLDKYMAIYLTLGKYKFFSMSTLLHDMEMNLYQLHRNVNNTIWIGYIS